MSETPTLDRIMAASDPAFAIRFLPTAESEALAVELAQVRTHLAAAELRELPSPTPPRPEPVAWGVMGTDGRWWSSFYEKREDAEKMALASDFLVPLYAHPSAAAGAENAFDAVALVSELEVAATQSTAVSGMGRLLKARAALLAALRPPAPVVPVVTVTEDDDERPPCDGCGKQSVGCDPQDVPLCAECIRAGNDDALREIATLVGYDYDGDLVDAVREAIATSQHAVAQAAAQYIAALDRVAEAKTAREVAQTARGIVNKGDGIAAAHRALAAATDERDTALEALRAALTAASEGASDAD